MRFQFIFSHRNEHTVVKMCEVMGVSTSGYYAWEKRKDQEETEREKRQHKLDEQIRFHFYDNLTAYGSPRIHLKLVNEDGFQVSQKTVANRMKELGLFATKPKKFIHTTDSDHEKPKLPFYQLKSIFINIYTRFPKTERFSYY